MARRPIDAGPCGGTRCAFPILILIAFAACSLVYLGISIALRRPRSSLPSSVSRFDPVDGEGDVVMGKEEEEEARGECCRGIDHLELWGAAVKWGTDFKFNSTRECCRACKAMCKGDDGPCLCDSWVFCGNKEVCKEKFGECWLKKQTDVLDPAIYAEGEKVMWTSGLVFGKGQGIIGIETAYGTLHIKLFPECAPHSVAYIRQLMSNRHCAGCQFYRAESRGESWNSEGNHISDASSFGPPYGLIQGTLEADGLPFVEIPKEACPTIRRGSAAWVGSGPEFIVSLANHFEWKRAYTVFGSVLPEDMTIAEKIARLPTKADVWNNVNVSVLEKPISLKMRRVIKNEGDLNLQSKIYSTQ